jgi:hypothetical protein
MNLDLLVVADMANVDASGKFNIVGEFNLIFAAELPSPPVHLSLVTRLVAAASEGPTHRVEVAVVDQDGRQFARTPPMEATFGGSVPGTSGDFRAQLVMRINGARFPAYGPYSFQVLVDGRFVGGRTIYVVPHRPGDAAEPA